MISDESESATDTSARGADGGNPTQEEDEVHELQDHEFTLELDDNTVEIQSSAPPAPRCVPPEAPLPRWAAASRALLDGWQRLLEVNGQATLEIPPGTATGQFPAKLTEKAIREKLTQLAVQLHAREVYCREIERALVNASGRARGQAFRIAELEAELLQLRARILPSDTEVTLEVPAQRAKALLLASAVSRDDLRRIRGIGPRFAARLAALGVTSFETIANWSASDLTSIAKQLGVKRERLTSDSWVKQARALKKAPRRRKPR